MSVATTTPLCWCDRHKCFLRTPRRRPYRCPQGEFDCRQHWVGIPVGDRSATVRSMETSEEVPQLGRFVRYVSKNGDGIISPAVVIRTQAATVPVEEHKAGPHMPLTYTDPRSTRPQEIVPLETERHVDLLVHGLFGDYREFNVPFMNLEMFDYWEGMPAEVKLKGTAGTWHWPVGAPERL